MSSISKPDHCTERPSSVLLSAYQEYLMTFKLMTSQVIQRARPLITYICVLGIQRVDRHTSGSLGEQEMLWEHEPQASVSTAFLSSPKLSRVFL